MVIRYRNISSIIYSWSILFLFCICEVLVLVRTLEDCMMICESSFVCFFVWVLLIILFWLVIERLSGRRVRFGGSCVIIMFFLEGVIIFGWDEEVVGFFWDVRVIVWMVGFLVILDFERNREEKMMNIKI